jgi:hypothetical protein
VGRGIRLRRLLLPIMESACSDSRRPRLAKAIIESQRLFASYVMRRGVVPRAIPHFHAFERRDIRHAAYGMPNPDEEARRLLAAYANSPDALGKAMERITWQFTTIQSRSQLLLTLATITLTITGFSGAKIASSGVFARWGLGLGLSLVLISVILLLCNLRIRWLSHFLTGDAECDVAAMMRHRNAKTRWYTLQIALLGAGLCCYVSAIIAYLIVGVDHV